METEEMDEGNTDDASATELVVAAYAEHPGAVTALASGPPSGPGRRTPSYVLTGSSQGALGLYPLHLSGGLSGGQVGGDPQSSQPALGVADPQGGAYGVAAAEWTIDSNQRSSGATAVGGVGGWGKSPLVSVGVTGDGSRCAALQADGVASVHAPEVLGGPAVACWHADPIASAGMCWRADGGAVVTVGSAGLK
jgi:hypothetical protein